MTTPRTGRPRRPARSRMASRLLRPSALLIHLRLQRTARVDFHQSASASSTGVRRCTIEAAGTHGWLIDVKQAPSATRRLKTTARTGERGAWFRVEGGNSADTQCQHEAAHGQTGAGRDESGFEKDTGPRDSRPSGRGGASSGAPARRAANDDRRAGVLPRRAAGFRPGRRVAGLARGRSRTAGPARRVAADAARGTVDWRAVRAQAGRDGCARPIRRCVTSRDAQARRTNVARDGGPAVARVRCPHAARRAAPPEAARLNRDEHCGGTEPAGRAHARRARARLAGSADQEHAGADPGRREGKPPGRTDELAREAVGAVRRQVPDHRLRAVELRQFGHPPHRHLHAVQGADGAFSTAASTISSSCCRRNSGSRRRGTRAPRTPSTRTSISFGATPRGTC